MQSAMNSSSLVKAHYHSSGSATELHPANQPVDNQRWAIKRETSSEARPPKAVLPSGGNQQSQRVAQTLDEYTDNKTSKGLGFVTSQLGSASTAQTSGVRISSAVILGNNNNMKGGRSSIQSQKPPMSASNTFQGGQAQTQYGQRNNGMAQSSSAVVIQHPVSRSVGGNQTQDQQNMPGKGKQPASDETSTFLDKAQKDRIGKLQNDVRRTWSGVKPE